jgi:hypothetical protein
VEPVVPVELAEPVVQAVPAELVIVPAVEAVLELDPVVVAPRTKSVIAALPCGLLEVLAAEDLVVAVVETMHAPAAAEAAVAWAAAE